MKSAHARSFILVILTFSVVAAQAQDTTATHFGWKKETVGNLSFTQTSFDNWVQGGENAVAWQADVNAKFIDDREKFNWSNTGKVSFGRIKVGGLESRKAADEIKLESVFTYKWGVYVNPYIAATGLTQIATGYSYADTTKTAISAFMDPGYFTQSFGIGYSPAAEFKSRLGVALKETFTKKYPVPYADDPKTTAIEKTKTEIGAESVTDVSKKVGGSILWTSKLELFSNLKQANQIDVNFDNIFSAKVSKYINVALNVKLFYDRDISKKRQLKQVLSLGMSYALL